MGGGGGPNELYPIMQQFRIDIGGGSDTDLATISIDGCPCRMKPFINALIEFVGDWKSRADSAENTITVNGKSPCGCSDKKSE